MRAFLAPALAPALAAALAAAGCTTSREATPPEVIVVDLPALRADLAGSGAEGTLVNLWATW